MNSVTKQSVLVSEGGRGISYFTHHEIKKPLVRRFAKSSSSSQKNNDLQYRVQNYLSGNVKDKTGRIPLDVANEMARRAPEKYRKTIELLRNAL